MIFRCCLIAMMLCLLSGGSTIAQEIFKGDNGVYSTHEITLTKPVTGSDRVIIKSAVNLSGMLTITAAEQTEIRVVYTKQAKTDSRSKAIDFIDLMSVGLEVLPRETRVELRAPNPPPWNRRTEFGRIEAELTVPVGSFIEVDAAEFDVTARGPFKSVRIPSSLGRLDITGVTEELEATTANQRVTLEDISGRISVSTSNSSILARTIVSPDEQARFRTEDGDIRVDGFKGSINVKSSFGRITISGFEPTGSNFIRGNSAPIRLEIIDMSEGQVVVSNRHEDIEITIPDTLSAFFSLAVDEDGTIEATDFPFTSDLVRPSRLNLISGKGTVDISGSIRGKGNIYVRGRQGE